MTDRELQLIRMSIELHGGVLYWLPRPAEHFASPSYAGRWNSRYPGKPICTCLGGDGYKKIHFNGKQYAEHRIIWFLHSGTWPANEIDHLNGDRTDNCTENLRPATRSENARNMARRSDNTSGTAGVHWHKERRRWAAWGKPMTPTTLLHRIILSWQLNRALAERRRLRMKGYARPYKVRGASASRTRLSPSATPLRVDGPSGFDPLRGGAR